MPGICGLVNFNKENLVKETTLYSMTDSLKNLEEEKVEVAIDKNTGLGVCSMATEYHLAQDDKVFVIASGEPCPATGDSFAAAIDTLYKRYEEDCAEHIDGQFSFCIWDKRNNKLLIATDRFGTNVINYYHDNKRFIFASKIRTILKTGFFKPSIEKNAIYNYLVFSFVPTPQTIYKDIKKLPPGHILILHKEKVSIHKYWDIRYLENKDKGESYYCEKIRGTLEDSVRKRFDLTKDAGHIGAFLSGGLDSSTVSGMMKKINGGEVKTFSIGFGEKDYSEIEYVDIAARHFGLKSYKYFIKPDDLIRAIEVLVKEYDEPFGNSSAIAAYYCMKLAKESGVDIMLGGDGGDENFAGYERYVTDKIFSMYQHIPNFWRKNIIEPCLFNMPFKRSWLVTKARDYIDHSNIPNPERFFMYSLYSMYKRDEIFTEEFLRDIDAELPLKMINQCSAASNADNDLNRHMYLDTKLSLIDNDLAGKIGKIANILNITVRYPMLDTDLWNLGNEIPHYLKLKGLTKKYIFKNAFKDFLPQEIILKKKHGFGLPYAIWLRENKNIRRFTEEMLLDSKSAGRGYFKKGIFEQMLRSHDMEKTPYYGDMLWVFLMLEVWHREWIDGR